LTDLLEPIVARLGELQEQPAAAAVEAFARAVLRRVPADRLEEADPYAVAAALADAFDFVDSRASGDVAVRLIDPPVALDGDQPRGTVLELSCDDRQFIVTTVQEELHRLGQRIVRLLHPVYGARRGPDGRLVAVLPARTAEHRESFLQVELANRIAPGARPGFLGAIRSILADVFAATGHHDAMRDAVARAMAATQERAGLRFPQDEVTETVELLAWLLDGNFVLLGSCRLRPGPVVDEPLGILVDPTGPLRQIPVDDGDAPPLVRLAGTAEISRVHRQVPVHRLDVVEVAPDGSVAGVFRLVGVFSNKGNAEPAAVTPMLRWKLARILELEDVVEGGQDEAALVSLFQQLPKDQLFETDVPTLRTVLTGLLAEDQEDVRTLLRAEPQTRTVSALVSIPQELYSPALRHRVERFLLSQLDGSHVETQVSLGDRADALLRFAVRIDGPFPSGPLDSIERELRLLCRTWDQELAAALKERLGDGPGGRLAQAWASWFPAAYRVAVPAAHAVEDALALDRLVGDGVGRHEAHKRDIEVLLTLDPSGRASARLKVLSTGTAVELSRFLPILESLGLWAVEELSHALGPGSSRVHLHDFGVNDPTGAPLDVQADGARLSAAAVALWHGHTEVDSLNRLVLTAGLTWEDVAVLRAYHRYRNQVGTTFTTAYVAEVLVENGGIARDVVELFAARFDPARSLDAPTALHVRARVVAACDAVVRLDQDRVLRGFLALVDATLRTNRYLRSRGATHLALKFESAAVPGIQPPIPYREIFVYGPSVEGVHLRWGPVARGGIRWSDRTDDYRTEVVGLMRAQVLKNALIVPTGAKGGFVLKRRRHGTGSPVDVRRAYEIFVTCLLEVTDNVVGDRVVPVPGRRDGDDPYLVVAADRGTATFSDLANHVSMAKGFWLGDAFASGGSHGYDHKRLGITARGAWVAVRHHFAAMGVDVHASSITVAGIGDMSGDVFGNGMLRSDRMRLVAAFDHRDVFLDPDPDPAVSYAERLRLFANARSTWQDYDRTLISRGGGVWSRLSKRIELSGEVRAVLGLDARCDHMTPPDLIRAILQAPVDLLFAGGIGTFVRASTEPDVSIDDRANSEVRVEASSLRARVVGEGANLAFTQPARIEYARLGGRINTDAIDNSAGVDISDHEVNIKILLRHAIDADELTAHERDGLLHEVCDDVVAAVLRDSSQQSLAISRAEAASAGLMDAIEALLGELEETGVLDRAVEALPDRDEMRRRAAGGEGLTRPELAVVMAGAKRSLTARLLLSGVPDQPAFRPALTSYFPPLLVARFDHLLDGHRLHRELIASRVSNDVVNRMGPTFVCRLTTETGVQPHAVVAAYWVARGVADAPAAWKVLDGEGDHGHTGWDIEEAAGLAALLESLTRAYLRRHDGADVAAAVARDRPAFAELAASLPPGGHPGGARLGDLELTPDVAELARRTGRPLPGVAAAFRRIGQTLGVDRLVERLRATPAGDRWSRVAAQGLVDDLDDLRRLAARRALQEHPADEPATAVARFLTDRADRVDETNELIAEIERDGEARLDAIAVALRALRRTVD
jgi:glutamate dehydrogenase